MDVWKILAASALICSSACGGAQAPGDAPPSPPAPGTAPAAPAGKDGVAEGSYEASILAFQREREAKLRADTGWLTIAGLFFLTKPETTFGADPANDIVLPDGAPPRAGAFELSGRTVRVKAAPGVAFTLGDKKVTDKVLASDAEGPPDRLGLGDLQLWVHVSGDRPSIRLRDQNSRLRREFTGTVWFPIDPAYRVDAEFTPYGKPKSIQVPNILGDIDQMTAPGEVSFTLQGRRVTMQPIVESGDPAFWFIFRDLTSGHETYPAARFIYMPPPVDGKMVVDFNRAENPPCAYNPYSTCPLPPEKNRLPVRIEAGEKDYEH